MEELETLTPKEVSERKKQKILSELNDAQKEVAINYKGMSLVSAGPGSGNIE